MINKNLEHRVTYHEPKGTQELRYMELRSMGLALAEAIDDRCPESEEKAYAMTKVEEAVMWANAAIARNE